MRRAAKIGIGVLGVVVVMILGTAIAVGAGVFQEPTVEDIQNEWGAITDEETEIVTTVVVNNPNPIGLPSGLLGVEYDVVMNEIEMATGGKSGIGLSTGINELELITTIDNQKIPRWWVTHINNGEATEMKIDPTLSIIGFTVDVPAQTESIETDILAQIEQDEPQEITALGRTLMVIEDTDGAWGEASMEETPLELDVTITNPNPVPIVFTEISYRVQMNEIVVAEGSTDDPIEIAPQSTEVVESEAGIDTQKLDTWWVSHLENDERTDLRVEFHAVVEILGEEVEVPLSDTSDTFETDILGRTA